MKIHCVECSHPIGFVLPSRDDSLFRISEEMRERALCNECNRRRFIERQKATLILLTLFLLIGGLIAWFSPAGYNAWMLLNVGLILLFTGLFIFPHELGHVLAARLLGMKIYSVEIGVGKKLMGWKWFDATWNLHAIPSGGFVRTAETDNYRPWKSFLMILAGPGANAMLILALLLAGPDHLTIGDGAAEGAVIGYDLLFANLMLLVVSLWPYRIDSPLGKIPNDGMKLLSIIRSVADPDEAERRHWYVVAGEEMRAGNYQIAIRAYYEILRIDAFDTHAKLSLASAQLLYREIEEARKIYLELLELPDLVGEDRAAILNQLAFTNLLTRKERLLDEARHYVNEALAFDPDEGLFNGTLGSILVMQNKMEEGAVFLRKSIDLLIRPEDKAIDLFFLARIETINENKEAARALLAQAEDMADRNPMFSLVCDVLR